MTIPVAQPGKTRIGWIGTGVMGRWMCQHVMTKGYTATVYNRSKDKLQPLLELGAKAADTPKEVAEQSDVVFAIVGFPKDVREVFLGSDGALAGSKPGTVLVDMTTSEPSLAREIYEAAKAKGVASLDAPVSGGDVGAKNAALSIMIGGDKDVVDAVQPLFECMGKTIIHQGGPGAGQHTKMVNQILIVVEHDRGVRGLALRLQGGARSGDGLQDRVASARPAARRWKSSARASWPATSSRASTSSTSSRTWASRWPKPRR